jgi:hypothetical protein
MFGWCWQMKELSVFIDESGDFGECDPASPYYLVSLVLHDQAVDIAVELKRLDTLMKSFALEPHAIHTGPLIRREGDYALMHIEERKRVFNHLFHFARAINFTYTTLIVDKRHLKEQIQLTAWLSKQLASFLRSHLAALSEYDDVVVYYDNGQVELTKVIVSVFSVLLSHVEFRKILPVSYRLAQVADMVCTLELARLKAEQKALSNSELSFFITPRELHRKYLRHLARKKFTGV